MMKKNTTRAFLVALIAVAIPVMLGCSSGGGFVQAEPQTAADLSASVDHAPVNQ